MDGTCSRLYPLTSFGINIVESSVSTTGALISSGVSNTLC
jgi:hypothetical protein